MMQRRRLHRFLSARRSRPRPRAIRVGVGSLLSPRRPVIVWRRDGRAVIVELRPKEP